MVILSMQDFADEIYFMASARSWFRRKRMGSVHQLFAVAESVSGYLPQLAIGVVYRVKANGVEQFRIDFSVGIENGKIGTDIDDFGC